MTRVTSMHSFMRGDQKEKLQETLKAARLFKKEKKSRLSNLQDDVGKVNMFRLLGLDYFLTPRTEAMASLSRRLEGRKWDSIPKEGQDFLEEHCDVELQLDGPVWRVKSLKLKPGEDDEPMSNIVQSIAERTGEERKNAKRFYSALVEEIRSLLKSERRARLPELGVFSLKYRPAQKGGEKKPNPFKKGEMMTTKARDAENKLTFRPAKDLKEYAKAKIKVSKPKSKSSSSSSSDDKKSSSSSSSSSSD